MFQHDSVLKQETIKSLNIKPHGTYVDCTVGGGGHAKEILSQLNEDGLLIAFDQDKEALQAAKQNLHAFSNQTLFIHANFREIKRMITSLEIKDIHGILFDLGVSSPQLDHGNRGFSYRHDARLDMRMNQSQELSAYEIINEWPYHELVSIFFQYGEERFSKQIARGIENTRKIQPIETTHQLVEIVKEAIPAPARRTGGHPAKRIFQALRIAVNDELSAFNNALHQAAKIINPEGRISVLTFHSLEDRLCKQAFKKWSTMKDIPRNLPIIPKGHAAPFKLITRKPIVASEAELTLNRRARSAKLRVVEKISAWDDDFTYMGGWRRS